MDINCDLGEGEPESRTRALLRRVTSANIACGGHAGTAASMRRCLQLCQEFGVRAGAHPSFADQDNFGRKELPLTPEELPFLLEEQIQALKAIARAEGVRLSHVKLHGALYHVVDHDHNLATAYVAFVKKRHPAWTIIAAAGGRVVQRARQEGVRTWGEIFAERGYLADGTLVPRGQKGALVEDPERVRERAEAFRDSGRLPAEDGSSFRIAAETICLHADSPNAVKIATILQETFLPVHDRRPAQ